MLIFRNWTIFVEWREYAQCASHLWAVKWQNDGGKSLADQQWSNSNKYMLDCHYETTSGVIEANKRWKATTKIPLGHWL